MSQPQQDCTSCMFFLKRVQQNGVATMCRRHPPTPQIYGLNQMGQPQTATMYPSVGAGDWCGDYAPKIELRQ